MTQKDISVYQGETTHCPHCHEEIVKGQDVYMGDDFPELLHKKCVEEIMREQEEDEDNNSY